MRKMYGITQEEELAVRFYMGDPAAVRSGIWRGGPAAYNTINALLHPGSSNERDKAAEGRHFGIEDKAMLEEYMQLIVCVFSAMVKYRNAVQDTSGGGQLISWRIDRASSLESFAADGGLIAGFFSTCRSGLLPQYARAKKRPVLLQVVRQPAVPFLDFSELLQDLYAKPEEAEVLLPFGSVIEDMQPQPLTEEDADRFRDMDGHAPAGRWRLTVDCGTYPVLPAEVSRRLRDRVLSRAQQAGLVMARLEEGFPLSGQEEAFYKEWKKELLTYVSGQAGLILAGRGRG